MKPSMFMEQIKEKLRALAGTSKAPATASAGANGNGEAAAGTKGAGKAALVRILAQPWGGSVGIFTAKAFKEQTAAATIAHIVVCQSPAEFEMVMEWRAALGDVSHATIIMFGGPADDNNDAVLVETTKSPTLRKCFIQ